MRSNVMLAGVGGQGLVMMTGILCQAAFNDGYDVKTNDVVGLSQRGGMVWGNVRFGKKIYSPNIRPGFADIVVGLEPLEALRWSHMLRKDGIVIINTKQIYPTAVQQEKEPYPTEEIAKMVETFTTISLDVHEEAMKLGKKQVANTILLGLLSNYLELSESAWIEAIKSKAKPKFLDINLAAFALGKTLSK